jgi:PAS domain S-box-containing protein
MSQAPGSVHRIQTELLASEERFRLLVESVSDYAIFLLDSQGFVQTWNAGARRFKGYEASEIIGRHFSTFYTAEDIARGHPQEELSIATKVGRFEEEGWRVRKDGSRFWANVVITRLTDSRGRLVGFAKVTRDLTERRRLEEQLRRSNEELDQRVRERTRQLEEAVHARDEFMSIASHELRTPVTSLKLQVQSALRQLDREGAEAFAERSAKFVAGAGRQLDRLARLIDDMLDVSRLSMHRLEIAREPVELGELVAEVKERFGEQATASGASLTVTVPAVPVVVLGDRLRLEQVLANLVINAIKYGAGQPIHVSLEERGGTARIEVRDQGIGIAAGDLARVFERFERAVSASSVSGLGLGLFICREIVSLHEGKISVESELGKGSTFVVELPKSV